MEADWRRRLITGIVALSVLALALRAQVLLQGHTYVADGVLLYGLAVAGFLWAFRREKWEQPLEMGPHSAPLLPQRRRWAILGGLACLASALFFGGNRFRPLGVLLWLGGLACFIAALDDGSSPARMWTRLREKFTPTGFQISWTAAALIIITLLGGFYRFYRLDELPADMTADIGHLWVDSERILQGDYLIFSTIHPGREIMMFYLVAGYARLFGHSYFAHKAVAACLGVVTIPLVYFLGRECFNRRVGLLAAFFLAVAKWPVIMSRIGWRLVLGPPFVALTCLFLIRALRHNRRRDWLAAGLSLGFSLYTYNALMAFVPAVMLALVLQGLLLGWEFWRRASLNMSLGALAMVGTFVPMGRFMLEEPERFWFRIATRITSWETPIPGHPVPILLRNLWKTALMFNYQGDHVSLANPPFTPQLDLVLAPLFVLGMACCLYRWRKGANALLLIIFGSMLLPGALSLAFPQEVPSAVRTSSVLGVLFLFPAAALDLLWQTVQELIPSERSRWAGACALLLLLGWICQLNFRAYFTSYEASLPNRNYPFHRALAEAIDDFAGEGPAYIKYVPYWVDGDVVRLQLRRGYLQWNNVVPAVPFDQIHLDPGERLLVILHPDDGTLTQLRAHYPRHVVLTQRNQYGDPLFLKFIAGRD
ncbi:MAG: glycosyltransferase family 39 protein [Chloroflexota bacterium]|nr:glycosyltransferase family 39 protein [Chloroflexota bacterium]